MFEKGILKPLTKETATEISNWEYESPYEAYSFKGHPSGWLMKESTWGIEQFCLIDGGTVFGHVSCQFDEANLWVGWSMAPILCGKGCGSEFIKQCVKEIRKVTGHTGRILLRVAAWNKRAIRAYQKAGFRYIETIEDEIAYSNHLEGFWVMELQKHHKNEEERAAEFGGRLNLDDKYDWGKSIGREV
ncbi:MAG: GNAT family N-acetyltransferase [Lachnospiraceae bacterium]|nr:GNAT family N-acetyltransferase [Lachnospiraceae bacterium]